MVENQCWVYALAFKRHLEVQVLGGGTTRTARQSDNVAGLNSLSHLHKVARLVAVKRFKAVVVTYDDAVAVTEIWS